MKLKLLIVIATISVTAPANHVSAQSFQNLDFEQANVNSTQPGFVPFTNALPHWTGYIGTNQATDVFYDSPSLGSASIDLFGPGSPSNYVIQGQYTLTLQSGAFQEPGSTFSVVNVSIAQTGLVPADARSILLDARPQSFSLTFAGQEISMTALATGSNYTLYGGDISAFAGQFGELRLSSAFLPNEPYSGGGVFDAISFSPQAIPEPSAFSLIVLGAVGLCAFRRRCVGGQLHRGR